MTQPATRSRILIVDDEPVFIQTLLELLKDEFETQVALNGQQAIEQSLAFKPDLILLDVVLPDIDGYEVCRKIKSQRATADAIVMFLTVKSNVQDELRGFGLGAVDYVAKPISPPILRARVRTQLALHEARLQLERHNQALESLVAERTRALREEIAERKALASRLSYAANYDPLTRLPNRSLFLEHLELALSAASRDGNRAALALIDLDSFKYINDVLGYHRGDQLLCQVAETISQAIGETNLLCRSAGDEFALIINRVEDAQNLEDAIRKLIRQITINLGEHGILSACVGIDLFPEHGTNVDTILRNADIALYEAKRRGKGSVQFFEPTLNHELRSRIELENGLREGLRKGHFVLHYQPIYDVRNDRVFGVEALLRWNHPEKGMIPPDDFIAVAEDCELIGEIGDWVVRQAVADISGSGADLHLAVNMSTRQICHQEFKVSDINSVLTSHNFDPARFHIEITESLMMENSSATIETLKKLRESGIGISVDDFGTGYSSLSYIRQFPITSIKIDRSFVHDINIDSGDAALIAAIISMGESLGLDVVAEGVETRDQLDFLKARKCRFVQGFLFARPVAIQELQQVIRRMS